MFTNAVIGEYRVLMISTYDLYLLRTNDFLNHRISKLQVGINEIVFE